MPTWTAAISEWKSDSFTFPTRRTQHALLSAGFTVLELTVVLFIVGLLLTIVIPHLGNTSNARLDATARRLAATVRYLSGEAALHNRPYRLNYDLDKHV